MADTFKPDDRQKAFIREAEELSARSLRVGRYAPDEFVRKMTEEGALLEPERAEDAEAHSCAFSVAASIAGETTLAQALERLQTAGCTEASLFNFPRTVLLVHLERKRMRGGSFQEEVKAAVEDIQRAFPGAVPLDSSDPNTLLDGLVNTATGLPPTLREATQFVRSQSPRRSHCEDE